MVIRSRLIVQPEIKPNELIERLDDNVQDDFFKATQEASNPILKLIRDWFKRTRPKVQNPFRWSLNEEANDRARKWWFKIGIHEKPTNGSNYIRQGNFQKAFTYDYVEDRNKSQSGIVIAGKTDKRFRVDSGKYAGSFKYNFLVGTFNQRTGANWQLIGHKRTGWERVNDLATIAFKRYTDEIRKRFSAIRAQRKNR